MKTSQEKWEVWRYATRRAEEAQKEHVFWRDHAVRLAREAKELEEQEQADAEGR